MLKRIVNVCVRVCVCVCVCARVCVSISACRSIHFVLVEFETTNNDDVDALELTSQQIQELSKNTPIALDGRSITRRFSMKGILITIGALLYSIFFSNMEEVM